MIPYAEIGNKIKEYFSEKGLSQQEAATMLGVQQAAVSNQLNGRPFGKHSAAKWNRVFGFRKIWLLTGEGPMFDASASNAREYILEDHPELNHDNDIPVVPARLFRAPDIDTYEYVCNSPSVERLPPVPHFLKHDLFATCPGDAMAPKIRRGYLMALRRMPKDAVIINGDTYVVDTRSSGMFVRKLIVTDEGFQCVSEDPETFPTFDIALDDNHNIFRVVGILVNM